MVDSGRSPTAGTRGQQARTSGGMTGRGSADPRARRRRLPRLADGDGVLAGRPSGRRRRQLRQAPVGARARRPAPLPVPTLHERVRAWREVTENEIELHVGDLTDYAFVESVIDGFRPDTIVHYGEQPSAPYSMIDVRHATYTQANNVIGNLNVLFAIRDRSPDTHLVKLGTMGEYGTPDIDIEEGYLTVDHNGRRTRSCTRRRRARCTTSRRSTTRTTSTSRRGSGASARPTSTRASSTASRPTSRRSIRASRRASTTTRCSGRPSTGSASRPSSASRSRSTARAARPAAT